MPEKYISVLLTMNQAQAAALVKFANHVGMSAVRKTAKNRKEAALMKDAIGRLLKAFGDAGYSLPNPLWSQPHSDTEQAQTDKSP